MYESPIILTRNGIQINFEDVEIKDLKSIDIIDEPDPAIQSKIDQLFIDDWNDDAQSFQIDIESVKKMIMGDRKAEKKAKKLIYGKRSRKKMKMTKKEMSEREIRKELKIHKKWMKTCKGRPANFSGRELYNVDFSNLCLYNANFQGAILKSVNFNGADLKRACFVNARFLDVKLNGANLLAADMAYATFSGVSINSDTIMTAPL